MDLNLSLYYQQQNDNKAFILTDNTNNYNSALATNLVSGNQIQDGVMYEIVARDTLDFTLHGATDNVPGTRFVGENAPGTLGGNDELKEVTPRITEITGALLDTKYTGTDMVESVKPQIDLFSEFGGPWTDQSQMVYTITNELLGGAADSLVPDGLYELDYTVKYIGFDSTGTTQGTSEGEQTLNVTILVYGQVKVLVYDKLRQIPAWCDCKNKNNMFYILEADLCAAYLSGIEQSAYLAKTEELLNMLIVLEDMVLNGTKLTY